TYLGALGVKGEAGDGVAVAVKGALENGDGRGLPAAQVQVGGQLHRNALGPHVAGTGLGETDKILNGGNGNRAAGPGRRDGQGQGAEQSQRRQKGGEPRNLSHGVCSSCSGAAGS